MYVQRTSVEIYFNFFRCPLNIHLSFIFSFFKITERTSEKKEKINENITNDVWRELLKRIGLDLLCVAVHYSKCYDNSDKFIENKADDELKLYTYYVKNTTKINHITNAYIKIWEILRVFNFSINRK